MLTTFTNLDYSVGGEYEPTQENFPFAKLWFAGDAVDGLTITERFSGAVFAMSSDGNTTANKAPTSGDISFTLGSTSTAFMAFTTNNGTTEKFRVGLSTGDNIEFDATAAADPLWNVDGTTIIAGDVSAVGTTSSGETTAQVGFNGFNCSAGGLVTFDNKDTLNAYQDLASVAISLYGTCVIGNAITMTEIQAADFDGFMLINFAAGLPSDFGEGLQWMRAQWHLGNYWIYPKWKGLA